MRLSSPTSKARSRSSRSHTSIEPSQRWSPPLARGHHPRARIIVGQGEADDDGGQGELALGSRQRAEYNQLKAQAGAGASRSAAILSPAAVP